jgi:hypothetical protein
MHSPLILFQSSIAVMCDSNEWVIRTPLIRRPQKLSEIPLKYLIKTEDDRVYYNNKIAKSRFRNTQLNDLNDQALAAIASRKMKEASSAEGEKHLNKHVQKPLWIQVSYAKDVLYLSQNISAIQEKKIVSYVLLLTLYFVSGDRASSSQSSSSNNQGDSSAASVQCAGKGTSISCKVVEFMYTGML